MEHTRILIVEDEEIVAGEIATVLTYLGYEVQGIAMSGEEAIALVEDKMPDIVLMDITLRGTLDGIQAADRIRERFDVPVVYLTAHDDEATLQQAKVTEPFGYIIKPFKRRELHTTIEIALYRHQMEQKLRESKERFNAIKDAALDALVMLNHEGKIVVWNKAAEQMFGYSSREAIGQELQAVIAPQRYYGEYKRTFNEYTSSGQGSAVGKIVELVALQRNGTEFPIELSFSVWEQKDKWHAIGIIRDITLRKQAEQQLCELNQQLQLASRHKSDFLANMSHELRTPLNAMIGYTSLTLNAVKDLLPSEHLQNLTRAEQSARVLLQLINDVLDFSKIEAGRLAIFIEDIEFHELLEEVIITAKGLLSNKPVELKEEFASDLPVIESDYTRLKQILDNLVGNAVKFTDEGSVAVRAALHAEQDRICVEVQDSGCGISPELMGGIFELFRQADGSIKKKFGGTGLGLAITKRLSDMLGIQIDVQSEEGKGTRFVLEVPLKVSPKKESVPGVQSESGFLDEGAPHNGSSSHDIPTSSKISPASSTTGEAKNGLREAVNALVLGFCEQEMCVVLKRHLAGLPLEVYHTSTVEECLEKARTEPIWAIVLEEGEDGFETLTQLKNEPVFRDVPVIMSSSEVAQQGFHVGPVEYLEKPVDNKKLLEALLRITRVQQGNIMVVDDDTILRALYERVLTKAGYTTYGAANGKQALEILRKRSSFQAIILDLMMPDIDGFQVLEQIQQDENWQRIPVVVVTAKTLSGDERSLLRQGTKLLLEKGEFSVEDLSERIKAVTQSVALGGTRSILVVDDNAMNLNLIVHVFETAGYAVYKAGSAQEGIDIAHNVLPNTILMDLGMPGMDGYEATHILKQHPDTANITVIACSAFTGGDHKERAFQMGCEGYITKPIEPKRLVEQVTKLVLASKIKRRMASF